MHESELVFAYGSNMDPDQMRERCPESDLAWFVAEARGWRLWFPHYAAKKRKCAVGSIVKEDSKSVWGVVFAVTRRDLERLGRYEGSSYERCTVDVVDRDGRQHTVLTYIATPDDPLPQERPSKDYMSLYIRGAQYFGLPEKYVDDLKRIPTG